MGLIREGKGERDSKEEREREREREGGGGLIGANEQSKHKSPPCITAPLHSPCSSRHTNIHARTHVTRVSIAGVRRRKQPFQPRINININKQCAPTLPAAFHLFLCSLCHVFVSECVSHTHASSRDAAISIFTQCDKCVSSVIMGMLRFSINEASDAQTGSRYLPYLLLAQGGEAVTL